jgi:general secretion pathway protein G
MFPLNTDYDLFSLGANRATAVSVGQAVSLDDVIRANDGGFFGKASDY